MVPFSFGDCQTYSQDWGSLSGQRYAQPDKENEHSRTELQDALKAV